MATTGLVNGTLITLDLDGTVIDCETTSSLNVSRSFRETVCKSDAPYGSKLPGKIDWSVEVSGYVKYDGGPQNHEQLLTLITAGTATSITYGTQESGDPVYTGSGYLSDVSITAGTEETAEFSGTISGTGTLTLGTTV
jgi:hypothetical protein